MKNKLFIFLVILFIPVMVSAESLNVDWQKRISDGQRGDPMSLYELEDGGYIVSYFSNVSSMHGEDLNGSFDTIIEMYNSDGSVKWRKIFGGNGEDKIANILQDSKGDFILYGNSSSTNIDGITNHGTLDAIIMKMDRNGNIKWINSIGGYDYDVINEIFLVENDNIFITFNSTSTNIAGLTNYGGQDVVMAKFDSNGDELWRKSFGGDGHDSFASCYLLEEYNILCDGRTSSSTMFGESLRGKSDLILAKINKDGDFIWKKTWGGNKVESILEFDFTEDGGFITIGNTDSTDIEGVTLKGGQDIVIMKHDKDGNLLWIEDWGGSAQDVLEGLLKTEDGGYVSYGYTLSTDIEGLQNKGEYDGVLVKYDKNGKIIWQKSYGGSGDDTIDFMIPTSDGGFVGYVDTYSTDLGVPTDPDESGDIVIVKFDKNGDLVWEDSIKGTAWEGIDGIYELNDGSILAYGITTSIDIDGLTSNNYEWCSDVIIVKYSKEGKRLFLDNFAGESNEDFEEVIKTSDGGFMAFASTNSEEIPGLETVSSSSKNAVLIKYSFKYDVIVEETKNGSIDILEKGNEVIITANPNDKYVVDKIIVKDVDGNELDIVKNDDGTYSVKISSDVSIGAIFKEEEGIINPETSDRIITLVLLFMLAVSLSIVVCRKNRMINGY